MKRLYLAAAVAVWSCGPVAAQNGGLAPTTPVVPAPALHNGSLHTPAGGVRLFAPGKWLPTRDAVAPASHTLPAGVSDAACASGGCNVRSGSERSCCDKLKAWLTYHPTNTDLPRLRPTPYITPLLGMFPCSSGPGCTTGCATGGCTTGQPVYGVPAYGQPTPYTPPMPTPMPPRGMQGSMVAPTWQGRATPADVLPTSFKYLQQK